MTCLTAVLTLAGMLCCACSAAPFTGELLHNLWREQPDAAAQQPFPYKKKLKELLHGDPYFSVIVDSQCNSHYWIKLDVFKIKGMLNF